MCCAGRSSVSVDLSFSLSEIGSGFYVVIVLEGLA